MDQSDRIIRTALGDDNKRNEQNSIRFREYLLDYVELPIRVTGNEDFPWEEGYVIGGWSRQEYQELKKSRPSYTDEFDLLGIGEDPDGGDCDLLGAIRRVTDGKMFAMGLSWLKAVDQKSDAFRHLHAYSVWHCNY